MKRLLPLLVVGALVGCGDHTRLVVVPKINTAHLDLALERLHAAGLHARFGSVHQVCGDLYFPKASHQRPRAGTQVPQGSVVSFRFGGIGPIPSPAGPIHHARWAIVPKFVGESLGDVASTIPRAIWGCLRIHGERDIDASRVVIVGQRPAAGTRVPAYGVGTRSGGFRVTTVTLLFRARR